jgi:hypothetical protein
MSPRRALLRLIFVGLAAVVLFGCIFGGTGGGTETESAVGFIYKEDGSPAVAARVVLRPSDYLSDTSSVVQEDLQLRETTTNSQGRFAFDTLPPGQFRIEAVDGAGKALSREFTLGEKDHLKLGSETLLPVGSISGNVLLDTSVRSQKVFVQVYGLERLITVDSLTGKFTLPDMPAGWYDLRFLSLKPVLMSAKKERVRVDEGRATVIDTPITLQSDPKLTFSINAGALEITGLGASNPVIFDNERWDNGVDDEYLWSLASAGRADLIGNIVTNGAKAGGTSTVDDQMAKCAGEIKVARMAGMAGIPMPVAGSRHVLAQPKSTLIDDMLPDRTDGSDLIVAAADSASPENPLIVIVGGPPTTVANAYLTKPSIASKMIVICILGFHINAEDSLATYIVSKRCRTIHWGRGYSWNNYAGKTDPANLSLLPNNWMGQRMRAYFQVFKDKLPLGDLAPAAYMINHSLWKSATQARIAFPLTVTPGSNLAFDFLDIPVEANDWAGFEKEFFSALSNPLAYRPQTLPGTLEAESFSNLSGARIGVTDSAALKADSNYAFNAVAGIGPGAWCDYSVFAPAGAYNAVVAYRSREGAKLTLGPAGAPLAEIVLPPSSAWTTATAPLTVAAGGNATWRVTASSGSFDLDRIDLAVP